MRGVSIIHVLYGLLYHFMLYILMPIYMMHTPPVANSSWPAGPLWLKETLRSALANPKTQALHARAFLPPPMNYRDITGLAT